MKRASSITRGLAWRLRLLAAVLAVGGQIGLSGTSLTLARDESSTVSHTERSGIDLHYGHNEATCAACAAFSFHASVGAVAPSPADKPLSLLILVRRSLNYANGPRLLSNSCRAPPIEA
jgi:hypothetical protein